MTFLREQSGNVLPLAALGMLLSAALVGGGIDMGRAYRVENRLQSACDSAVLAARRTVTSNGYDDPSKAQADAYFKTNFNDAAMETTSTVFTTSTADNGQTIDGTANTQLNLAVMKLFGFQKFNLAVQCSASMGVGNSDVVMVLDTTGSMGGALGSGTRISALQSAMKSFYTTVKTATQGTNARIRYGFVPYSSTVNVGRLIYDLNPSYLVETYKVHSRRPVEKYQTTTTTTSEYKNDTNSPWVAYTGNTTVYTSSKRCENNMPSNGNWANNGQSYALPANTVKTNDGADVTTNTQVQPQKRKIYDCEGSGSAWTIFTADNTRDYYVYTIVTGQWVFDYWSYERRDDFDYASYKRFQATAANVGSSGNDVISTWAGCIEERDSVAASSFTYSTITGITPAGALDLDIDSAPGTSDDTKWAPMWPEVAYIRENSNGNLTNTMPTRYGEKVGSYCPAKAQLLKEMDQATFNSYTSTLKAEGSTYLDIGMAWGGRLSSPDGIFKDTVNVAPDNGGEVSRHIIFMSDGQMEPNYTIQSAWGIEYHDRRVTDNGSSNDASRHTSRFLALCAAIKAKGIRIWTISFTTGSSSDLTTCASPSSAFNADDATELNAAFQEIAKQVGELRLTQ